MFKKAEFPQAVRGAAALLSAPPAGLGVTGPRQLASKGICSYLQRHEKVRVWGLVWGWAGNPRLRICPFPGLSPSDRRDLGENVPKIPGTAV